MKVNITTQRGTFNASLKLPWTVVLGIATTLGGLVTEAVHAELSLREVRHELALCRAVIQAVVDLHGGQ